MNPLQQNYEITLNPGEQGIKEYSFTKNEASSSLWVSKEETQTLSYKATITYNGMKNMRPNWTLRINDQIPSIWTNRKGALSYAGAQRFEFKPEDQETLEVQETDEQSTTSVWVDLAKEKYEAYVVRPASTEKIQTLVNKGKIFKPAEQSEVKKIFFSRDLGVFLHVKKQEGTHVIYHAKETEEFSPCESKVINQYRGSEDFVWEVKLNSQDKVHTLDGGYVDSSMKIDATWDRKPVESIHLN